MVISLYGHYYHLHKTLNVLNHRLKKETIDILISNDNQNYTLIARDKWTYKKDYKGDITLQINTPVTARYIKVHSKYDDWDVQLNDENEIININRGEFTNILKDIIRVYKKSTEAEIIYSYDNAGNRTKKITNGEITDYTYYPGTNRLMSDETYAYVYDEAGNLIKKGNSYNIGNNTVTFTTTKGEGIEYYEYEYNLENRLSRVKKNNEIIAEFKYNADGMRIKTEEKLEKEQTKRTTYYIYGYSGKVLMEESSKTALEDNAGNNTGNSSGITYTSYIYAFGKSFAKVNGILNPSNITTAEISYFHYDNIGSTRLMTDSSGNILIDQDYLPFGGDLPKVEQVEVFNEIGMEYKYTGQNEVVSIGLYYYGARYYDPATGRFITEDTYPGEITVPQSQNLYVYVMNNPLRYIDPTGHDPLGILFDEDDDIEEVNEIVRYGMGYEDTDSKDEKPDRSSNRRQKSKTRDNNTQIEKTEYSNKYYNEEETNYKKIGYPRLRANITKMNDSGSLKSTAFFVEHEDGTIEVDLNKTETSYKWLITEISLLGAKDGIHFFCSFRHRLWWRFRV